MRDEVDAVLAAGVERGAAPGAAAIVVDRDGVRYRGAAGERALGSGVEMTTDTVGALFSMTKPLTGAAAMQLVEQGELDLDAPAGNVCSEIGDVEVLDGFDDDGQPVTRPPRSAVTLRQLLTHTSGYVYNIWNTEAQRWHEVTGTPTIITLQNATFSQPLLFDPGARWEYGIGIDWVGKMIEQVSGMTLGAYFAEYLTGPLGMVDTTHYPTPSMLERASAIHARLPDGSLAPIDVDPPEDPQFEPGGHGLFGTVEDYARFSRMFLREGELDGTRVLAPETVALMTQNHIGDLRVQKLVTAIPELSNDAELFPGDPKSWGLTFQVSETPCFTGRPAGTLMWAGLANSYFWIDRQNDIAGTYLSQILPFGDLASMGLFLDLERTVYDNL